MGIQGIVLEHHGDITVLGFHIVHQLAVDPQLAAGDILQAGHHPQSGGLAAAGGTDQHDEFPVRDLQVEVLNCQDAFLSDLKVGLLFGFTLLFLFGLGVGIYLLNMLQAHICHDSLLLP